MTLALAIAAGLAIFGTGIFILFAVGSVWISYLLKADKWWSFPAWMASMLAVFVPMVIGVIVLSIYVLKLVAP